MSKTMEDAAEDSDLDRVLVIEVGLKSELADAADEPLLCRLVTSDGHRQVRFDTERPRGWS